MFGIGRRSTTLRVSLGVASLTICLLLTANYTPEVQSRLDGVLRRIAQETGVYVRDFQTDPRITAEHYIDTTHLSFQEGVTLGGKIIELLAQHFNAAPNC